MSLLDIIPSPAALPYFCDSVELPDTLPTLDEIEQATESLTTIRDPRYNRIVVVKGRFVVKYGIHIAENEGHALLFIEKHKFIPAPKLYAMYREKGKLYLIMSYMPGIHLKSVWDSLSEGEKFYILEQLRSIWDQLRLIPAPTIFSGVCGGPLRHRFFLWLKADPRITGPFQTEEDLDRALALRSLENWQGNQGRPYTPEFFARHLPKALQGHASVFTHGDLHRRNILIEQLPSEGQGSERRFRVSAIVDWEDAGWYPSYWEYAAIFVDWSWHDDWPEMVERIVDAYPLESAMLRMVRQDLDY
jgi:aminoglycoside phosphotransferase (APT) family kinase protein